MKVLTVVGARPQFIKAGPVSLAMKSAGYNEYLVHTGQHYDFEMSDIFFQELKIPVPSINLSIGSGGHGEQTGKMLVALEQVIQQQQPDVVIVYGDTNSTLAGALAAVKLGVKIAHVESGLRSFNRTMPEEHNRVLTDHAADLLLCPTQTAIENLAREGITRGVHFVGDTMLDAVRLFGDYAEAYSTILETLGLEAGHYLLATVHRPYNTDTPEILGRILRAFEQAPYPVVFPVHPRTRARIAALGNMVVDEQQVRMIQPQGYLDMLKLLRNAHTLLTDSGGMQKEAYFCRTRCITLRPETEWIETLQGGWNVLVGADETAIVAELQRDLTVPSTQNNPFGDGYAAGKIVALLGAS